MYKIFADDTLIYDSTLEDYKIGNGSISREIDKSGSFTFSIYPDHFFYDSFVRLKTVITVYKSGKIVFRGRILNDVTDYYRNKVITCEGELGFLQDSVIRPFEFTGTPEALFKKFINEHNFQVDEFKRFKIGTITVVDPNNYVNRSSTDYGSTLSTLTGATTETTLSGHIYITHGDDGTDPIPTIHYISDFPNVATQFIEFGSNLKNYTKTVKAEDIATAIIPLGSTVASDGQRLTIADVNNGVDYVSSEAGVALYGRIFKTVVWEDVTLANNLKAKAEEYLESVVNQNITIELNAIDLHLLDHSIESFNVCDYVHVVSKPHNLDAVLLCNKQTIDLLKPENDTVVLGYATTTFTRSTNNMASSVSTLGKKVSSIKQDAESIELRVEDLDKGMSVFNQWADGIEQTVADLDGDISAINQRADSIELSVENLENDVGTKIQTSLEGITLSATAGDNQSTIKIMANGVEVDSEIVKFSNITADSVAANNITGSIKSDKIALYGDLTVYQNAYLNSVGGYLGYTPSTWDGTPGMHIESANGVSEARVTNLGAELKSGTNRVLASDGAGRSSVIGDNGVYVGVGSNYGYVFSTSFHSQNAAYLGISSDPWEAVYANTGTIQTSDEREKTDIVRDVSKYRKFFTKLLPACGKYLSGTSDRTHIYFIAQDVEKAMEECGLTDLDFAGLIKSPVLDEEGNVIDYAYALRYAEFIPLIIDAVQDQETRLQAVEKALGLR